MMAQFVFLGLSRAFSTLRSKWALKTFFVFVKNKKATFSIRIKQSAYVPQGHITEKTFFY